MAGPTNPKFKGEYVKFRKKNTDRLNREGSPDKSYGERTQREMDMNRDLQRRGTPIQKARQANVPAYDRARYIAENGVDIADRGLYNNNKKEFNRRVGATVTRNLLEEAFRKKSKKKSEIRRDMLRESFKEDVLNDKPGTRTNIIPGDLDLRRGPKVKKDNGQVKRQRNWERWREMGESKERTPSGPAIDSDSAYYKMQESRRKKKW